MKKFMKRLSWSLCLLAILTESAWAYLDPGTGSLILQSLIAGVAGAMVVGRLYWERLKGFVSNKLVRISSKPDSDDISTSSASDQTER